MSSRTCTPENFEAAMSSIVREYTDEQTKDTEKVVKSVARSCAKNLRSSSPRSNHAGKHYADGWKATSEAKGHYGATSYVHNTEKPGLTHLLEKGHETRNGGFVSGRPHIAPAYEQAAAELERRLKA